MLFTLPTARGLSSYAVSIRQYQFFNSTSICISGKLTEVRERYL